MLQGIFGGGFDIMELLYRLPAILISLSFHEWGHAYVAYRCGDPTARNLGRMSINPLRHIDPIGFLCLLLFRFGWAKPVPVNPRNFKNMRRDDTLVSLAGVTVNFGLAIISMLCMYLYAVLGQYNYGVAQILLNFLYINLALAVFNLIPIPPLDGSHILENLFIRTVGPKPFYFLHKYGNYILLGLMISGILTRIMSFFVGYLISGMSWIFEGMFSGLL